MREHGVAAHFFSKSCFSHSRYSSQIAQAHDMPGSAPEAAVVCASRATENSSIRESGMFFFDFPKTEIQPF